MSSSGLRRVHNLLNAVRRNLLPAGRGLPKTTLPDGQKVLFTYERQIPWADRAHGVAFSTAASIASGSCILTLPYIFWNYWFAYGSIPRDKSSTTDDATNDGPTKPELQPAWLRATVSAMTVGVFGGVAVAAYMQRTRAVTRLILLPPLPSATSKAARGLEGHRLFVQLLHHRGQQGFIQPLSQCKLLGTGEPSFMRDSSFDLQLDNAAEPFVVGLSGVSMDGEAQSELDAQDELLRRFGSDRSTLSNASKPAAKRRPSAMWVKGSGPAAK